MNFVSTTYLLNDQTAGAIDKYLTTRMAFLVAQVVKNLPAVQESPVQFLGQEDPWRRDRLLYSWASLMVQVVKNLPAMWETWVRSVGWEDPLKEGMAAHSSILAWSLMDRGSWQATVHGVAKSWT